MKLCHGKNFSVITNFYTIQTGAMEEQLYDLGGAAPIIYIIIFY